MQILKMQYKNLLYKLNTKILIGNKSLRIMPNKKEIVLKILIILYKHLYKVEKFYYFY